MVKHTEASDEINGLRDLTVEQREDIEALCEQNLMPSQIARRLDIPTRVVADARRSWNRQKELEKDQNIVPNPTIAVPTVNSDPLQQMMAITQQQISQTLLRAQVDSLLEDVRHRKVQNRIEEQERQQELDERRAKFGDEFGGEEGEGTQPPDLSKYNFENDPFGALMQFAMDLKQKNAPEAPQAPQEGNPMLSKEPLSEAQIASYAASIPATELGKALLAIGTPYQKDLEANLTKLGVTSDNVKRIIVWLAAEKKRRGMSK